MEENNPVQSPQPPTPDVAPETPRQPAPLPPPETVVTPESAPPIAPIQTAIQTGSLTTPANHNIWYVGLTLAIIGTAIIIYLTSVGAKSEDEVFVDNFVTYVGYLSYLLAFIIGIMVAYKMLHPRKAKKKSSGRYVLVLLGFIFGGIAGLIFGAIISYPLSQQACRLSGSKYC